MECPTEETLRQLCRGQQSEEHEALLFTHVDRCTKCQTLIEQLGGGSLEAAQSLQDKVSDEESVVLQERLRKLKKERPSSAGTPSAVRFEDLSPWIDVGDESLGRVDEYDLVRCVGRGGMGVVFEAYDRKLQRSVALKLMSPALLAGESNGERFLREARTAASINHPNVVSIHAVSKIRELPYLVMELVDGDSLQQKLETEPPRDIDEIGALAAQIADGLSAAHAQGVVHRDVKPANILIERGTGRVKLTDFGLARRNSDDILTQTGSLLGTPEYLAPEQIDGGEVDFRADLFSLGSVIYHMCVGAPPYASNSIASTLHAVATTPPTPIRIARSEVPAWLSGLVECLHARNPAQRPADAASVARMLRDRQRPAVVPGAGRSLANDRSRALISIAAIAGALLLGLVLVMVSGRSTSSAYRAENATELMDHIEQREGDLEILLVSNEESRLEAIHLEGRSMKIAAGEGFEPTLIFGGQPDETAFHCEEGELVLAGLRIETDDDIGPADEDSLEVMEPILSCAFGSITLQDCEIDAGHRRCLSLAESHCTISQCRLDSEDTAFYVESADSILLELDETTIQSQIGFEITAPMEGRLLLDTCTFEGEVAFELIYSDDRSRLDITSNDSQF
ncbi:MAG: serine/threonine-protein kinase, partial [Lacipirellulaceae bacterium]